VRFRHLTLLREVNLKKSLTPYDIKIIVKGFRKKSSIIVDLISAKHFEHSSDLLLQHLSLLFQMSSSSGIMPQQFCIGQITSIPKKGKKKISMIVDRIGL